MYSINSLPNDIIKPILAYLDPIKSLQSLAAVSVFWNKSTIEYVNDREFSWIKELPKILLEKIDSGEFLSEILGLVLNEEAKKLYLTQIKCLRLRIIPSEYPLKLENLIQVKLIIIVLRERKTHALKSINQKDLENLKILCKHQVKPLFFNEISNLAKIYEKINQLSKIANDKEKWLALKEIFQKFLRNKNIDKAVTDEILQVVNTIIDNEIKNKAFYHISTELTGFYTEDAIEVAQKILDDEVKIEALCNISEKLTSIGEIDKAVRVAETINDDEIKSKALYDIIEWLTESDISKAIRIAEKIVDDNIKYCALEIMSEKIMSKKNADRSIINKIIELANTITDDEIKNEILSKKLPEDKPNENVKKQKNASSNSSSSSQSCESIRRPNSIRRPPIQHNLKAIINNKINAAKKIDEDDKKSKDLQEIFKQIISEKSFDKFTIAGFIEEIIKLVNEIINDKIKDNAFLDISKKLTSIGNIDEAIRIANAITDNEIKSEAFLDISEELTSTGNIDKAIEIAKAITNNELKNEAFLDISKKFASRGNIDRAIEITDKIDDNKIKYYALSNVSKKLTLIGEIDRAIMLAQTITDDEIKSEALSNVSEKLTLMGEIDRAVMLARTITDDEINSKALCYIVKWLTDGDISKAIRIAKTINHNKIKAEALQVMSEKIMSMKNADRSIINKIIELANTITNNEIKNEALLDITKKLICFHTEKAFEVVKTIKDDKSKGGAVCDIFDELSKNKLINKGNLDRIIKTVYTIDDEIRNNTFFYIFKKLKRNPDSPINEAIEVAEKITAISIRDNAFGKISEISTYIEDSMKFAVRIHNADIKYWALNNILRRLLKKDVTIYKLIEVAQNMPSRDTKNETLSYISKELIDKDHDNLDEAIEVANRIDRKSKKYDTLDYIFDQLPYGDYDNENLIKIAQNMPDQETKDKVLYYISIKLASARNTYRANEIAHSITDDKIKNDFLNYTRSIPVKKSYD